MTKILIITEDFHVGKALETFMESNGFSTVIAPSILHAWKQVKEINFNMVLVDSPKETVNFGTIPVLYLCSVPSEGSYLTLLHERTQDYLIKPFKAQEFKDKVNHLLQHSFQERYLRVGDLKIDVHKQMVMVKNKVIA